MAPHVPPENSDSFSYYAVPMALAPRIGDAFTIDDVTCIVTGLDLDRGGAGFWARVEYARADRLEKLRIAMEEA